MLILAAACAPGEKPETLARRHCSSCHLFPEPSLLDKKTWKKSALPEMAFRMGLDISQVPGTDAAELNDILNSLPAAPLVSEKDWQIIQEYYVNGAPDSLSNAPAGAALPLEQFRPATLTLPVSANNLLTLVQADADADSLYVGTREGKLLTLSPSLRVIDSLDVGSAPSRIQFSPKGELFVTCMGMMDPNDRALGSVVRVKRNRDLTTVADSLKRPVDITEGDLNNDNRNDLVVSAFGNFTGGLIALENTGTAYKQHIIHNFPGTRRNVVADFDNDGLADIMTLIAQGDERIALLTNRGDFRFSYRVLLKFPPVYGSSYFELRDFNGDGYVDILYTNGDNADYSSILKPYHGVRIFLNDGQNAFTESFFYPLHGASVAMARDFDDDGDADIAAISFFPDFARQPDEGFLYLRNDGGTFTAFKTPLAASSRWIAMECVDLDSDADTDIVLAALAFPASVPEDLFEEWGKQKVSLLILRNNLRP
jgi:hypothetical protein